MAELRIKYSDVASSCSSLTSLAEKLEGTITNINNAIEKIKDPTWDGTAAQNYVEKLKQVSNNIPDAKVQLASSVLFLASCSDGYQSLDKESYKKLVELVGGQAYIDSYDVSKAPDIDLGSRVTDKEEEKNIPVESGGFVDSGYDGGSSGGGSGSDGDGESGNFLGMEGLLGANNGITSAVSDGITDISSLKEGEELEIPDTINQENQSIVGFDSDLKTGEARTYTEEEKKLIDLWISQGSKYTNGIATIELNGEVRYLVSVSPKFGKIGDSIDLTLKDGTTVKAIIFETKKIDSTKSIYGDITKDGKTSIVNYEVSNEKYKELGELSKEKWEIEWDPTSPVTKIKNNGNIMNQIETTIENTQTVTPTPENTQTVTPTAEKTQTETPTPENTQTVTPKPENIQLPEINDEDLDIELLDADEVE